MLRTDASGCWLWVGAKSRDGYGKFWNGHYRFGDFRRGPVTVLAHRWAYERFLGAIPEGNYVLHRCDVPSCVNPSHLFVGTQATNVADCARKGRRNQTRYQKLSAELHNEIRARYRRGGVSQAELGREFGVSQSSIGAIVRRDPEYQRMSSCQERGRRRAALARRPGELPRHLLRPGRVPGTSV